MPLRLQTQDHILDFATLDRMHAAAADILSRTGLMVEHQEVRDEIARHAGFTLRDGRILIAPDKVEAWRQANRAWLAAQTGAAQPTSPPKKFTCYVGDRPTYIVDRDGKTIRPMTRDDVIAGTKLLTVLRERGVYGSTPGVPTDVPLAWQPIEQFMIGARYSPAGGATSQVCDLQTAQIIRDLDRVYGRPHGQSAWCSSPLVFGGPGLDILWHFRNELTYASVGSMPMMGINGPCDPIAVFTLSMAECIGGAAILHELLPDVRVSASPHPEPCDLRTGAMVFGTPEWDLLDLMHRDVYGYYGKRRDLKYLLTTAALPNEQAVLEHACSAMTGMLSGYRHFGPAGQLALDEVYSPAMLILDLDLLAHAERIARGVNSGEGLELDVLPTVIDEVLRANLMFGEHATTIQNMRTQYHQPAVMQRLVRNQWEHAGRPDPVREAQNRADTLITQYTYEPPQDILRDLTHICDRAKQQLGVTV